MYYKEVLVKNWSNPKDVTVKDIAMCMMEAPEKDIKLIVDKLHITLKRATNRGDIRPPSKKIFSVVSFYHKVAGC